MALYTSGAEGILRPEEVGALVVQPVARESVAFQVRDDFPGVADDDLENAFCAHCVLLLC